MALGTYEVTPLQIAAAYAAFANGGTMFEPTVFSGAVDNTGEQIRQQSFETRQVINPTTAYMITDLLSDVIKRGTARKAHASFNSVAVAGKTGTSRDGWFVGYTPNLVCVVWVGFDDNEQLGMTGAEAALPAWIDFMKEALAIRPSLGGATFPKPSGIVTVKIDPESGELAGPNCPSSQMVSVSYRFAPRVECFKHLPEAEPYFESLYSDEESSLENPSTESGVDEDGSSESIDKRIRERLEEVDRGQREREVKSKADRQALPIEREPIEREP
jgi:penicillin-binding protein 1B